MDFVAKAAFKQQAKAVGNDFFGSEDKESKAEAERKKKHANAQEDAYRVLLCHLG
jgi:ribosomal protein L1